MHIIQVTHREKGRRVGLVNEPDVILLDKGTTSSYQLFLEIINQEAPGASRINSLTTNEILRYDDLLSGSLQWNILPPIDCPGNPMNCMVSGTGLTHKASAENRQKMHDNQEQNNLTDSMKMYLWGEEGGKAGANKIGVQPEWFYKGNGYNLKGHGQLLHVPNYADDGGEEPEIAGIYLISNKGIPYRVGFAQGNEFSDHVMEKKNYLFLAPSKIRTCSIGPELVLNREFDSLPGVVRIVRNQKELWSKRILSGEAAMSHSLANLEHHHFKYDQHRVPGQLHIHFFGTGAFSFGENIILQQGDEMQVSFEGMGRPLINTIDIDRSTKGLMEVKSLNK